MKSQMRTIMAVGGSAAIACARWGRRGRHGGGTASRWKRGSGEPCQGRWRGVAGAANRKQDPTGPVTGVDLAFPIGPKLEAGEARAAGP